MIQMFVTHSIATRSLHDPRGMLLRDRLNGSPPSTLPGSAEDNPPAISQVESAVIDSGAIEEGARVLPTAAWRALRVALGIFGLQIVAATFLAIVVFSPGLKLLGFFLALAIMTYVCLPMLLATISVATEDATAQKVLEDSDEHERLSA